MAQVTIYLPDEIQRQVKREARKAGKSVSAYLGELATRQVRPPKWPAVFEALFGSSAGTFPEVEDLPLDEPERL